MDDDDTVRAQRARKASPFLGPKQAAHYLGLAVKTLANMRSAGTGPHFRRHGHSIRYHIDDLEQWSRGRGGRGARDA
jgi:hypothetical protein